MHYKSQRRVNNYFNITKLKQLQVMRVEAAMSNENMSEEDAFLLHYAICLAFSN